MKKIYQLKNAKGGAAVTLVCLRSKTKRGWGKIHQDGNIEFLIPEQASDSVRDELITTAFKEILNIQKNQIEIFSGNGDRMIVTIIGVESSMVDQVFSKLK